MRATFVLLAIGTVAAACATTTKFDMSPTAPSPDPRVGLRAGWMNAGSAAWNLRLVSAAPKPAQFTDDTNPGDFAFLNSDLAFTGHYVIQGNFHGLQVWDIAQPGHPTLVTSYVCPDAPAVHVRRGLQRPARLRHPGRARLGEQGPHARHPHLRHLGHRAPQARHQRADLPRLAHPHRCDRSKRPGEHLHLRVGLGPGAFAQ